MVLEGLAFHLGQRGARFDRGFLVVFGDRATVAGWSFEDGWLPSYPETTGYIIETMLAAAPMLGRLELVDRARRMIDWELSIQLPNGTFPGHFAMMKGKLVVK